MRPSPSTQNSGLQPAPHTSFVKLLLFTNQTETSLIRRDKWIREECLLYKYIEIDKVFGTELYEDAIQEQP